MQRRIDAALLALQFLTVIRLRPRTTVNSLVLGESLAWFPTVGVLLGGALALVAGAGGWLLGPAVAAALVISASVFLTGALHLDGLADCADGLFGGHTRERRLEILRDSRIGTFGATAVILALLLQVAALGSMTSREQAAALAVALVVARVAMVWSVAALPYARPTGLGRMYRDGVRAPTVMIASVTALAAAVVVYGAAGGALIVAPLLVTGGVGWLAMRRLGGMTGDVYGAVCVLTETLTLLACAAASRQDWLAPRFFA